METIIRRYKRQNIKGFKGVRKIISEERTILKWRLQYLWYKYFIY
jgi:hypothetical protein